MRGKSLALLMLALGCGLVASIGITQVLAKRNVEPASTGETQSIYIAIKDIPLNEPLTADVLKLDAWPKGKIPPGALTKLENVEGRRTRTKFFAGEPILENKLFAKGLGQQGGSSLIPKDYRVVPVKVDSVSGGPGLILPGDRVDVLVHLARDPSREILETSTRTILQDIKVFAVDDVVDLDKEKEGKGKETMAAKTISLLVTPQQAAKLTLATEMGKVRLVMRGPEADSSASTVTANPSDLLDQAQQGKREKEALVSESTPLRNNLSDLLEKMKNRVESAPKHTEPVSTNQIWTMRILNPDSINEVVLESEKNNTKDALWRLSSTTTTSLSGDSRSNGNHAKKVGPPPTANQPNPTSDTSTDPTTDNSAEGPTLTPNNPIRDPLAEPSID